MKPHLLLFPLLLACSGGNADDSGALTDGGADGGGSSDPYRVSFETTLGAFEVQLNPDDAPVTTENFLVYVDEGFYDGTDGLGATVFHRVIPGFMNQGGGETAEGALKTTHEAIVLESQTGLSNLRGTIAMARTGVPDSATSQFFINTVDNTFLDYADASNPGYAVFGEVVSGMDVLDAIAAVETDGSDRPVTDISIVSCTRSTD